MGAGGDNIYFSDTDVPRENKRRAQSRGRFSELSTQSRGNLLSVKIHIHKLFGSENDEK